MATDSTVDLLRQHHHQQQNDDYDEDMIEKLNSQSSASRPKETNDVVVYDVEHLATFPTTGSHEINGKEKNVGGNSESNGHRTGLKEPRSASTPKVALQWLFELEKLSGIWTQRMQIELRDDFMLIVDCETNSIVERFDRSCVREPEAFNQYNDIYNNIVVFLIQQSETRESGPDSSNSDELHSNDSDLNEKKDKEGELHIFQCVSHRAQELVNDILTWKTRSSAVDIESKMASVNNQNFENGQDSCKDQRGQNEKYPSEQDVKRINRDDNGKSNSVKPVVKVASSNSDTVPIVNVNVKETVQVFNQIAALREKSKPTSPTNNTRPLSDASAASSHSNPAGSTTMLESLKLPSGQNGGQFYKQRSIRVKLAPENGATSTTNGSEHITNSVLGSSRKSALLQSSLTNSTSTASSASASVASSETMKVSKKQVSNRRELMNNKISGSSRSNNQQHHSGGNSHSKSSGLHSRNPQHQSNSDISHSQVSSSLSHEQLDQVSTNESYVSVLNHCFDDIEKFIIRLQQAVAAIRELQIKRKLSKRSSHLNGSKGESNFTKSSSISDSPMTASELATLNAQAKGPNENDYFEILSKFKLAFNLLAKLKGCIHEPNAPELVHFLFTPLAVIIESARNATPPIDPTIVGVPYLNQDALDLLSNCCTSKESDLWISLGSNWTRTIDANLLKASRLPSSFQPIFSDGWAPIIRELELIGLVAPNIMDDHLDTAVEDPKVNEMSHTHHHDSRSRRLSYEQDDPSGRLPSSNRHAIDYQSAPYSNGYSGKIGKSHLLLPSQNRYSDNADPYISSVPYGRNATVDASDNEVYSQSRHQEYIPKSSRAGNQISRGSKPSSRRSGYLLPTDPSQHLDLRYPDESRAIYQDEYMPEQFVNHHSNSAPGPSSRHHRHANDHNPKVRHKSSHTLYDPQVDPSNLQGEYPTDYDHEAMLMDLGPAQTEWFFELQARGAMTVRVLFTREANNDKELSVHRGEILEVLDDTRKWWRARNIDLQVAHVPHTIVATMHGYQSLDELLANNPNDLSEDNPTVPNYHRPQTTSYRPVQWRNYEEWRNSKTAGAFRYF